MVDAPEGANMPQVFKYKQKLFPKALVAAVFVAIAATPGSHALFRSLPYWGAFAALQVLFYAWNASRRITVDEQRLEVRGFGIPRSVAWESVEEATLLANLPARSDAIIARAANKPMGPTTGELVMKLVVTDGAALYVRLGDLRESRAFADLVLSKVRFVREKLQSPDPTSAPPRWVR
jgi:hypothetical protein